ncbi:sensor histidine kinase [Herbidospora mongoliensis]|uniref:sensor histidine kinase n=1 Tax=Herbidospora mongoliensis TaxID=688067 RepID=UPI00082C53C5|nr:HAMP domain-containing sensor histidine kinase [Herbidospora mongoliensis]
MSRWSVRLRATVTVTLIVAVALGVASAVLIGVLRTSLVSGTADEAGRKAEQITTLMAAPAQPAAPMPTDGPAKRTEAGATPLAPIVITDPDVLVTQADPEMPTWTVATGHGGGIAPDAVFGQAGPAIPIGTVTGESYVTATRALNAGTTISVRASLAPTQVALQTLIWLLVIGIPLLLAMVAGLTWFSVGRALAPVSAIRAKLADITARDLHQRVPEPHAHDEIAALATTVNGTLDRLETAVDLHKRFVADAAHELRSPIATLRTRLELGQRDAPALAKESLTDVTRLQSLAADLLVLARLDAGEPLRLQEVDLGQLATEEAVRLHVPMNLDISPGVVVRGSPAQLTRVITNLLVNAARHCEKAVSVRVAEGPLLEVLDDGPGIPVEHRERVFHRFTRLDEARDRDAGGAGLGLAIAREIVIAHGGTLTIEDSPRGALFRLTLP